ncbi:MAG: N-acetyltransferase family protein [Oscillospiraceae bacterium]
MSAKIRFIQKKDSNAVLSIYSPYILNTAITFEYVVPSIEDFKARIDGITSQFPYVVCEIDGEIAGYAYASKHHERKAYQWNRELSVYIAPPYFGKRIATAFYHCLLELLKLQGYKNVYTLVNTDNEASCRLHHSFGFQEIGLAKNTGYKFEKWHDIATLLKQISKYDLSPIEPKPINEIEDSLIEKIFLESEAIIKYESYEVTL